MLKHLYGFGSTGSGFIAAGKILAGSGSYVLTGSAAGVQKAGSKTLTAAGGTYSLTGTAANVLAGFTPYNLTGLIGWWDMQVPGSITQNTGRVVNLADQSGAGNHLGDGVFANKPTYNATGLNSRPALSFANNSELDKAGFPMGTGNTLTVFAVATMSSSTENYGRMFCFGATGFQDNNSVGSWTVLREATNQKMWFQRNGVSPTSNSIAAYNTPFRVIATINSSGVMTIYVNNSATATATQSGNWIGGGQFRIGGNFVGDQWTGVVGEVGVATGYSDATTVGKLDTYLKNRWGL